MKEKLFQRAVKTEHWRLRDIEADFCEKNLKKPLEFQRRMHYPFLPHLILK